MPFLFPLAIDWVLKTSTAQRGNGNQWTTRTHFDDLNFANGLALSSQSQKRMQEKTSTVADNSFRLGLKIHRGKSKVLKNKAAVSTMPVTLEGGGLEGVTNFTYLGSIVNKQGGGWGGGGGGVELIPM